MRGDTRHLEVSQFSFLVNTLFIVVHLLYPLAVSERFSVLQTTSKYNFKLLIVIFHPQYSPLCTPFSRFVIPVIFWSPHHHHHHHHHDNVVRSMKGLVEAGGGFVVHPSVIKTSASSGCWFILALAV